MSETKISYLDATWNPVVGGCSSVSDGCTNCWARALHTTRHKAYLAGKKLPKQYAQPWSVLQILPERLEQPLHWKKPRRIGVCFGTDLFLDAVSEKFLDLVVCTAFRAHWHQFFFLTKRPKRMADFVLTAYNLSGPYKNFWLGVTICNQSDADKHLRYLQWLAQAGWNTWVSYESALGPVDWRSFGSCVSFLAAGGETGPDSREASPEWFRAARNQCAAAGVPFHFKAWGSSQNPGGRLLDGRTHDDVPRMED